MTAIFHALMVVLAACCAAYLMAIIIRIFGGLAIALGVGACGLWLCAEALQLMPMELVALIPAALMGWCLWLACTEKRRKR